MKKLLILCMLSFFIFSCDDSKDPVIDPDNPENPEPGNPDPENKNLQIPSNWYLEFDEKDKDKIRNPELISFWERSIIGPVGSIELKTDDGLLDVKVTVDRDKDSVWVKINHPDYIVYDIECFRYDYAEKVLIATRSAKVDDHTTGLRLNEARLPEWDIPLYTDGVITFVDDDVSIREVRATVTSEELGEFLWIMSTRYSFYQENKEDEKVIWKVDKEYLRINGEKKIHYSFKDIELTLYWDDVKDSLYISHQEEDIRILRFNHPPGLGYDLFPDQPYVDDPGRSESIFRIDDFTLAYPLGTFPGEKDNSYGSFYDVQGTVPAILLEKTRRENFQRYLYRYTIDGNDLLSFLKIVRKNV